jgi:hypothetical protein
MLISVMQPDAALITYFLERIHYYYPIGMPQLFDNYPGYRELKKIQHEKMVVAEHEQPVNWFQLAAEVKKQWSECQVTNMAGTPFPAFKLHIDLQGEEKAGTARRSSLLLIVSLLVNYYSIVVIDDYVYRSNEAIDAVTNHKFLCSGENYHLPIAGKVAGLKSQVESYFPEYRHAPHYVIFNYKVRGGFSHNAWYENMDQNTIFDFLFCSDFVNVPYTVAH